MLHSHTPSAPSAPRSRKTSRASHPLAAVTTTSRLSIGGRAPGAAAPRAAAADHPFEARPQQGAPTPPVLLVHGSGRFGLQAGIELALAGAPAALPVQSCATATELYVRTALGSPGSIVLVDTATDPTRAWRPAERVIARVDQQGGARVVAWSGDATPDAHAGALRAGARAFLATGQKVPAADRIRAALIGDGQPGAGPQMAGPAELDRWVGWVQARYGLNWEPWMEAALALLAGTGERAALAEDLVDQGAALNRARGVANLRRLAKALGAEEYRSPSLVAREAHLILATLGTLRPLAYRPQEAASLADAARALEEQPSLAVAAMISEAEHADVLAVNALIADARARVEPTVGAPEAGRPWQERRWAAGRLAARRRDDQSSVDGAAADILARVNTAVLALNDAMREAAVAPLARAAAALLAAAGLAPGALPADVEITGGRPRWRGLGPDELLLRGGATTGELDQLTRSVDATLRTDRNRRAG